MNTNLRNKAKTDFEKDFFKLMNNAVFGKPMENMKKHRDIKIVTTKFFTKNLLAMGIKKTQILMNKLVYLRLSILELNKMLMYEFWYDYVKPRYGEETKLCYMDRDSCIQKNR